MSKPKVYLAGPISGLTYDEGQEWRAQTRQVLAGAGIDAFSPLRGKESLRTQGKLTSFAYDDNPLTTGRGVVTRDYHDTVNADLVIANLLGVERVSVGTVMEIAWCYAWRVPLIVVRERISPTHPTDPHAHLMIQESTGYDVETIEQAIAIAIAVLLP